jgi:hypothetical protein
VRPLWPATCSGRSVAWPWLGPGAPAAVRDSENYVRGPARARSQLERASQALSATAHTAEALAISLASRVEALAVVGHRQHQSRGFQPQLARDLAALRVADRVVEALLEDEEHLPAEVRAEVPVRLVSRSSVQSRPPAPKSSATCAISAADSRDPTRGAPSCSWFPDVAHQIRSASRAPGARAPDDGGRTRRVRNRVCQDSWRAR